MLDSASTLDPKKESLHLFGVNSMKTPSVIPGCPLPREGNTWHDHLGAVLAHNDPMLAEQAASYYAQAKNSSALADALYRLEDFEGLEQLTAALPEEDPLLLDLGQRFQSVGLCQQAAAAYVKVYPKPDCVYCHYMHTSDPFAGCMASVCNQSYAACV